MQPAWVIGAEVLTAAMGGRVEEMERAGGGGQASASASPVETAPDAQPSGPPMSLDSDDRPLCVPPPPPAPGPEELAGVGADPAAPAPSERLAPNAGETMLILKDAHVDRIMDGSKTLVLRPWRMKRLGRWFLATHEFVHGKVTLGAPFAIANAEMWTAHEPQHLEGAVMRHRTGYCWAYPVSRPIRLQPLPFFWMEGAITLCKYRPAPTAPPVGAEADPIVDSPEAPEAEPEPVDPSGAPKRRRSERAGMKFATTIVAPSHTFCHTGERGHPRRRRRRVALPAARSDGASRIQDTEGDCTALICAITSLPDAFGRAGGRTMRTWKRTWYRLASHYFRICYDTQSFVETSSIRTRYEAIAWICVPVEQSRDLRVYDAVHIEDRSWLRV